MTYLSPFVDIGVHPHVFSEYDFQINRLSKIKSVVKIETQIGTYALKKSKINSDQFQKMNRIIKYLDDNRFPIATIIPNKFGDLYIPGEDGIIYVTKWVEGQALTLNNNKHLLLAMSTMANMHKLGLSFDKGKQKYQYIDELYIKKSWQASLEWLKKYQRKIKEKESNTAFEHIFRTYIPFIQNWAEEAVNHLNDWVIQYNSIEDIRKTICHGRYHHRNIIMTPEGYIVLLDFNNVSIDTPVRDIAFFIRHYILNKEWQKRGEEWIEKYQKIYPLLPYERKLLSTYLIFPEKIISLAKRYDQKQKTISEDIYFKKLQTRWVQTKELIWFVDRQGWLYE